MVANRSFICGLMVQSLQASLMRQGISHSLIRLVILFGCTCLSTSLRAAIPVVVRDAIAHLEQNELEKAQIAIDDALQDPTVGQEPATWYYRGVIYEQLMRQNIAADAASTHLDQALQSYHKTLDRSNQNSQFHSFAEIRLKKIWAYYLNRGIQYYRIESFEEALAQLSIAKAIDDKPIQNVLYTAIVAHGAEKYDLAIQGYQEAIRQGSGEALVYQALAHLTATYLQQPIEAQALLDTALEQYPWDVGLLSESYQLALQTQQLEAKKAQLVGQLTSSLATPVGYYQLAYFCAQSGHWKEAVDYYQQVLGLVPKQLDTLAQLGLLYYSRSAQLIQDAIALPEDIFQKEGPERMEQINQTLTASRTYFEKASRLARKNIYFLIALHTIYTYLQQTDKAANTAQKLTALKGGIQLLEQ